jgi:septum formation protein
VKPLVLASTSPYRRELLARLGLPFEAVRPDYDELPLPGLGPAELARAHALGKARSVAAQRPEALVIGSDQVAEVGGEVLGKPGSSTGAVAQLLRLAGRTATFHTGLAVVAGGQEVVRLERFRVRLRPLGAREAEAYVAADRPEQTAGSFRIESLGIALMEGLEGRDFTALIGLPLIALVEVLGSFGVNVLLEAAAALPGGIRRA